jgi:beta-galactosidase
MSRSGQPRLSPWKAISRVAPAVIGVACATFAGTLLPPSVTAAGAEGPSASSSVNTTEVRITIPLLERWKFIQDDNLTDQAALGSSGSDWQQVSLPHTWNAQDAAGLDITKPYKRGIGWYRLEFDSPTIGARHWLEFGAASIVADVWLNGNKLGQHKGAFTAFRFDVTERLVASGKNVLLVKVDNSAPVSDYDVTAIIPLGGDFNMSGGLYRHVALISTRGAVNFDLGDMGGPGVYATTTAVSDGRAEITLRAKLSSNAARGGDYIVRFSLLHEDGRIAGTDTAHVAIGVGGIAEVVRELSVAEARLWQGREDPYQYQLVAELLSPDGAPLDKVMQDFGIRVLRFDPNEGFFLNGRHLRLHGVAIHQDYLGKGWAVSNRELDKSLDLVREIGANTIRLGHYPFSQYATRRVNTMGLIAWAELPLGLGVTTEIPVAVEGTRACPRRDATVEFRANAKQQLREMIRQNFNHASVAMWSLANELTFMHAHCEEVWYDNLTPVLRELQATAKAEDPSRVTTLADFTEKETQPLVGKYIALGGITDIWALNKYQLWYGGPVAGLGRLLDILRTRYPAQPIGVSEYGAGAALTHHTDNVRGGRPDVRSTGQGVAYQPEEYASYLHEQNFALLLSRRYVWGTYVWNMFDFGSGIRNEGDTRGVNTKGLVTFDRNTKKDPFYFYKANWSTEPVTYITGRRYTDRAYQVVDVKVYSNADWVQLLLNGALLGSMQQEQCLLKTCVFQNVRLSRGVNKIEAVGRHGNTPVRDSVEWSYVGTDVNIAAGQLTTGFKSMTGARFGSDNFFIGGSAHSIRIVDEASNQTPTSGMPDADLFKTMRTGEFSYSIPLADGTYQVTLGFLEHAPETAVGNRVFNVIANGDVKLANFDVLAAAGRLGAPVTRSLTVEIAGGYLKLDFVPIRGEATLSNITIRPQ